MAVDGPTGATSSKAIDDPGDPALDPIRDLRAAGVDDPRVIVEGEVALTRALGSGWSVQGYATTPARAPRLAQLAPDVPAVVATKSALAGAAGFDFHRGCIGWGLRPSVATRPDTRILDSVRTAWATDPGRTVVVAEGLADPSNLGAIARNARAFDSPLLICGAAGADPWSRRAVRASMGHVFTVPTVVAQDPVDYAVALAQTTGAELWAAALRDDAVDVRQVGASTRGRILMVGNEGHGLSKSAITVAHGHVRVAIAAEADSLNVAAASAVLLFALRNRRDR